MNTQKTKQEHFLYPIEMVWSEEDEGYIATVPDLSGCSAWGVTEIEAIMEVEKAAEVWLATARKMKRPIPKPSLAENYSGKFHLRLPKELHAILARQAKVQAVSLNQYILYLLSTNINLQQSP